MTTSLIPIDLRTTSFDTESDLGRLQSHRYLQYRLAHRGLCVKELAPQIAISRAALRRILRGWSIPDEITVAKLETTLAIEPGALQALYRLTATLTGNFERIGDALAAGMSEERKAWMRLMYKWRSRMRRDGVTRGIVTYAQARAVHRAREIYRERLRRAGIAEGLTWVEIETRNLPHDLHISWLRRQVFTIAGEPLPDNIDADDFWEVVNQPTSEVKVEQLPDRELYADDHTVVREIDRVQITTTPSGEETIDGE